MSKTGMNSSRARSCEQGATADQIFSTSSPFSLEEKLASELIEFF